MSAAAPTATEGAPAPAKKGKKKLIIIIVAVVLLFWLRVTRRSAWWAVVFAWNPAAVSAGVRVRRMKSVQDSINGTYRRCVNGL